jgi:serine/threonine protein kinase/tetratricopeptide (TPR) repeat protein
MTQSKTSLPAAIVADLEALLFRGGSAAERSVAVDALCAQHPDHAAGIRQWLSAVQGLGDGSFADEPQQIGPYRIVARLGQGGFGDVYLAEQEQPVRRRVALKVLKLGMDSAQVLQRFAREQDALARMSHDAIAKIYDAGTTPSGQPFFAMELVDGAPLTNYCDREVLPLRQRLELFAAVCLGVHHAHQKGVVHRDLKPSNVLVAKVGERHQPKLIDFGIARALEGDTTTPQLTETGMLLGTAAYMAPEQARGDLAAIDTRTDVYALGALLFELLTGDVPFASDASTPSSPWELRQRILDEATPRPSARRARTTTQASTWLRQLRGELDWIVLKAMSKEPERRYASAAELAADVERYLAKEPVSAGPPSATYRLRTFVRRHRLQVGAVVAVLVTAVAGAWVSIDQAVAARASAELAAKRAEENELLARDKSALAASEAVAKQAALERAEEATQRSTELQQVANFQAEHLSGVDPQQTGNRLREAVLAALPAADRADVAAKLASVDFTTLAADVVDQSLLAPALVAVERDFSSQPAVKAQLLQTIATALDSLGKTEQAIAPQSEALRVRRLHLGEEHHDTLAAGSALARLLRLRGRLGEAEPLLRRVVEISRRRLGDDHRDTLVAMQNLGAVLLRDEKSVEAESLLREVLDRLQAKGETPTATSLEVTSNLCHLLMNRNGHQDAEPLLRSALAASRSLFGDDHRTTILQLNSLARLLLEQGRSDDAEPVCREALERARRVLGAFRQDTLVALSHMGTLLLQRGQFQEAEPIAREALAASRRALGADHRDSLVAANNLASVLRRTGAVAEAEELWRDVIAKATATLGDAHASLLHWKANLVRMLMTQRRWADAEGIAREVVAVVRRPGGGDDPSAHYYLVQLSDILWARDQSDESLPLAQEALVLRRRLLGPRHASTLLTIANLGWMLHVKGQSTEAEPLLREARDGRRELLGEGHPNTLYVSANLAEVLLRLGKHDQALAFLPSAIAAARAGNHGPELTALLLRLADASLGATGAKDFAAIEAVLREVDERLGAQSRARAESIRRCRSSFVALYEAWHAVEPQKGHDRRAAEWRAKLE